MALTTLRLPASEVRIGDMVEDPNAKMEAWRWHRVVAIRTSPAGFRFFTGWFTLNVEDTDVVEVQRSNRAISAMAAAAHAKVGA